jgi:hypothetical protein
MDKKTGQIMQQFTVGIWFLENPQILSFSGNIVWMGHNS